MKKVTITAIAKAAKVSNMSVSRALRGDVGVSVELKQQIEDIAMKLGYIPQRSNYDLSQNKRSLKTVGIVLPHLENTIFLSIIECMDRILSDYGYKLLLCCAHNNPIKEFHEISLLLEREVDGIIWSPVLVDESENAAKLILKQGCPLVFMDRCIPSIPADSVTVDDAHGAYLGVKHLLEQGVKKIAFMGPLLDSYVAIERQKGYIKALKEFNIPIDSKLIMKMETKIESGRLGMEQLLQINPDIDGVFSFNDTLAIGAYLYLESVQVRVPQDIAIVGFSNTLSSQINRVPLTTLNQDVEFLGSTAVTLLLNRMLNKRLKIAPVHKVKATTLLVRESSSREKM